MKSIFTLNQKYESPRSQERKIADRIVRCRLNFHFKSVSDSCRDTCYNLPIRNHISQRRSRTSFCPFQPRLAGKCNNSKPAGSRRRRRRRQDTPADTDSPATSIAAERTRRSRYSRERSFDPLVVYRRAGLHLLM